VPEEVMRMVGLGNLASRVRRVAIGRDTPKQFAGDIVRQIPQTISDMLTMPQILEEVATGKTKGGREMTPLERAARPLPITKIATEAYQRGTDYGPIEGAKGAAEEVIGLRFANVDRRDLTLLDSQVRDALRVRNEAKMALKAAVRNGPPSKVTKAGKELKRAQEELIRIVTVYKAERKVLKAAGTLPAKPEKKTDAIKDAAVRRMLKLLKEKSG
jgi:hypothetical protein